LRGTSVSPAVAEPTDERRLADSGLAANENHATRAGLGTGERRPEVLLGRLAFEQELNTGQVGVGVELTA
jgi:hypothetical protein